MPICIKCVIEYLPRSTLVEENLIPKGKFVRDIDCTPFTQLLVSERAEVPDSFAAVFELVDNAIEQKLLEPARFTTKRPLKIEVFIHDYSAGIVAPIFGQTPEETRPVIVVQDNAGGVDGKEFSRLFRFGEPGEKAEHGISAYGRGGKRARLRLGNLHIVISRKEKEYYSWWAVRTGLKADWEIKLYERDPPVLPKGQTRVAISDLIIPITTDWMLDLNKKLAMTYADLLKDSTIEIYINGTKVNPNPVEQTIKWSGATHVQPRIIKTSYDVAVMDAEEGKPPNSKVERVDAEITIGLTTETTQGDEYGYDIICNGRLLTRFVKKELGLKPNPKISPVRGIIRLDGPSEAMPWRSNKVEFDEHKLKPLKDEIANKCEYWVSAAKEITDLGEGGITGTLSTPFSGKMKIVSGPPSTTYKPPSLIGQQKLKGIAFKTTKKKADQAKLVFGLGKDKELNAKAKEIFENAVDAEASQHKGGAGQVDFRVLRDAGIPANVRRKLGLAGAVEINDLISSAEKKNEKDAIVELRSRVNSLTIPEAKKLYKTFRKMKKK